MTEELAAWPAATPVAVLKKTLVGLALGADLVLDLARAGPIDSGALSFFRRLGERQRTMGGRLHLTGLDPSIADEIERSGLAPEIVWLIRHHQVETAGTAGVVFGGEPLPGPLLNLNPSSTGGSSR
jgi:anti-anti-sigma regulatory factor